VHDDALGLIPEGIGGDVERADGGVDGGVGRVNLDAIAKLLEMLFGDVKNGGEICRGEGGEQRGGSRRICRAAGGNLTVGRKFAGGAAGEFLQRQVLGCGGDKGNMADGDGQFRGCRLHAA